MQEFETIYTEHFHDVYAYIFSLCADVSLAEEITQEAFYKALNHLDHFDGKCRLFVWLCQIAKNTLFTHLKKQKRESAVFEDCFTGGANAAIENDLIDRENVLLLESLLQQLQDPYKEVFTLRVFGELDFAKIGMLFGKSDSWARVVYYRAKKELRRKFDEYSL